MLPVGVERRVNRLLGVVKNVDVSGDARQLEEEV